MTEPVFGSRLCEREKKKKAVLAKRITQTQNQVVTCICWGLLFCKITFN